MKSAGPIRNTPQEARPSTGTPQEDDIEEVSTPNELKASPCDVFKRAENVTSRPEAPIPPSSLESCDLDEKLDGEAEGATVDYAEQLKRHGWRMQIPGDPLGLK